MNSAKATTALLTIGMLVAAASPVVVAHYLEAGRVRSVEVKIDDGPWELATLDPETTSHTYSWKFFTYDWRNATPGEHTLVSRVTDVNGHVQPTAEELLVKQTRLEAHAQFPRTVTI